MLSGPKQMSTPKQSGKPNYRKLLRLILTFILVSGIYRLAIHFYLGWIVHVYCIGAGVLINRGMLKKPEKSDLPDTMSDSEKDSFIAGAAVRRERSEFILYILFSLILSVMIDLMYIWLTVNQGVKLP